MLRTTGLLLILTLVLYVPATFAQTPDELQAQYEQEILDYGQTHTLEETQAYVLDRINQMTNDALNDPTLQPNIFNGAISNDVLFGSNPTGEDFWFWDTENPVLTCTYRKWDECRDDYNQSLYLSAALTVGIFAGCNGITALAGFAACTAAAVAQYAIRIAAAKDKRTSCVGGAYGACRLQYWGY